jgi:hypothetical protein
MVTNKLLKAVTLFGLALACSYGSAFNDIGCLQVFLPCVVEQAAEQPAELVCQQSGDGLGGVDVATLKFGTPENIPNMHIIIDLVGPCDVSFQILNKRHPLLLAACDGIR